MFKQLHRNLFTEVDASSIAVFRMGFGAIMLYDCLNYALVKCLQCYFINQPFAFKYYGFEWVQAWEGDGLYWHLFILATTAAGIMLGLCYRVCTLVFFIGFCYFFLIEQALYLNHFYMVILFSFLLCFIPAHRHWSLDALIRPKTARPTIPVWCLILLIAQLEIILIYAGLVKINDDWLNLEPLRLWLSYESDLPIFGRFFTQDWSVAMAVYGVIALHLIGAPLLLFRKTRFVVLCIYAAFHILNHFVFNIGIFPWFTLFATLLLFEPDWPKQIYNRWIANRGRLRMLTRISSISPIPGPSVLNRLQIVTVVFISAWLIVQVAIPLRHWVYPGNVAWNEEEK